jgi:hypothetical protein
MRIHYNISTIPIFLSGNRSTQKYGDPAKKQIPNIRYISRIASVIHTKRCVK